MNDLTEVVEACVQKGNLLSYFNWSFSNHQNQLTQKAEYQPHLYCELEKIKYILTGFSLILYYVEKNFNA